MKIVIRVHGSKRYFDLVCADQTKEQELIELLEKSNVVVVKKVKK